MLIQFSVTNYRRFRDAAVLDLSEARISEFSQTVLRHPADDFGILPAAALYGPNGCGKSSLLDALEDLCTLVLTGTAPYNRNNSFRGDRDSISRPTEWEVIFRTSGHEYDYQLKSSGNQILEENLFGRSLSQSEYQVLFDRDGEGVFLCPAWETTDVSGLSDTAPLLHYLDSAGRDPRLSEIRQFFRSVHRIDTGLSCAASPESFLEPESLRQDVCAMLSALDIPVTKISLSSRGLLLTHSLSSGDVDFLWEEESRGIQRAVLWCALLRKALEEDWILLADNPEICLHARLFGSLLTFFLSPRTTGSHAQMIFTSQELSNMNNRVLRRDEIWFAAPSPDGSSALYSLAYYLKENGEKVRKDETYYKQYLEGRYGADPRIV